MIPPTNAVVFLPWPHKDLSPNARVHWARLAKEKKKAKHTAHYTALEAGFGKIEANSITATVSFFPPDRRPRDIDNALASCKTYFDAIAALIGVDDSKWEINISPKGPIEKNGLVKVELEWSEPQ